MAARKESAWRNPRAYSVREGALHAADFWTGACDFWCSWRASLAGQTIHGRDGITLPPPPAVDAIPVTDDYFGTKIVDSYRWLEDAKSAGDARLHRRRECLHGALHEAGAHPAAGGGRSGRSGERLGGRHAHRSAATATSSGSGWPASSSSRSMCATAGRAKTSGWSIRPC